MAITPTQIATSAAAAPLGAPLLSGNYSIALSAGAVAVAIGINAQVTPTSGFLIPANTALVVPLQVAAGGQAPPNTPIQLYAVSATASTASLLTGA